MFNKFIPKTKNYKPKTNFGFTLVELIIVIGILSILSTIGFISYSSYLSTARDATRNTDMSNLIVSLKLTKQQKGSYPQLTNYFTIANSGTGMVMQGKLDDKIAITGINNIPLDPKNKVNYIYSTTINKKYFQIGMTLENGDSPIAFLDGDYKSVTKRMFPSLILAINGTGNLDIQTGNSYTTNRDYYVINNGSLNIPYDFNSGIPIKTASSFDSLITQNGIKLSGASDYRSCEEIYEAGKSMGAGEYQIMKDDGSIIDTICGDLGDPIVYVPPTINDSTDLFTLPDEELKLTIEDNTGNTLTDNWVINGCDSSNMTINTGTFSGGNQSISSLNLASNTFYKVPAGNYSLIGSTVTNGHINFDGNCIGLIGEGTGSVIFTPAFTGGGINGDGALSNEAGIIGVRGNRNNIIISGITINNNPTDANRYDHSVYIDGNSSNITVKDIKVSGAAKYGICLDYYNDNNYIVNAESYSNGWHGVGVIFHSKNNILTNIKTYNNGSGGVIIDNLVYNNYLENIISYGNTGKGVEITASASGTTLSGAVIYGNTLDGLYIDKSTYNTLENIKSYSNTGNGIFTYNGSNYNIFKNIETYSNLGDNGGIAFNTSLYNNLNGITTYLNKFDGITFDTASNYNSGTNISAYSNTRFGLNIYSSSGIIIENLNSYSNTGVGIVIDAGKNNILNKFNSYSNIESGLAIERPSNLLDYNKITNGSIYNNGTLGINIFSSLGNYFNNINIFNNNTTNTDYLGMITLDNAAGASSYNSFNNINIFNNNKNGIVLNPNNDYNLFNNIRVFSNLGGGLYTESGSINNSFNEFRTYNNDYGVLDYASVLTNKYYGTFNYFGNVGNVNITNLKQGTGSTIGFTDGTSSAVGSMDCSWHSQPNLATWGATCTDKGAKTSGLIIPVTSYNFGTNIPKQSQPVKWNGTAWELYGTGGVDYDTTKYIGQW